MKSFIVAAVLIVSAACIQAQTPPDISSTFQSGVIIQGVPWSVSFAPAQESGFMAVDANSQNSLIVANESVVDVNVLHIYSQKVELEYIPVEEKCTVRNLTDEFFGLFGWLSEATYIGQNVVYAQLVDEWQLNDTNSGNLLTLFNVDNTPIRLTVSVSHASTTTIIDFFDFNPTQPPETDFDIPIYCVPSASKRVETKATACIKRSLSCVRKALAAVKNRRHHRRH